MKRLIIIVLIFWLFSATKVNAQTQAVNKDTQKNSEGWILSGSWRSRIEDWDYFDPGKLTSGGNNKYVFNGNLFRIKALNEKKYTDTALEFSIPYFIALPNNAAGLPPFGPLGQGAIYRGINQGNFTNIFLKQAYVKFKGIPEKHTSLKLGRFEFGDGSEVQVSDKTLDWLKKNRINERLIGNFGFTHIQRSFDGFETKFDNPNLNATVFGAFPTQGIFDLQGHKDIPKVRVLYTGLTKKDKSEKSEGRLYYIFYNDARNDVLKVDNRPIPVRTLDDQDLYIHTLGGHYIRKFGPFDLLSWGALQGGDWGVQKHRAYAWDAEGGFKPPKLPWNPWLRAGWTITSGDNNPTNGTHNTFFQLLPTPRTYARTPIFNLMNTDDKFIQLVFNPRKKITTRIDFHKIDLNKPKDLWYFGGGAFRNSVFGYGGLPSGEKSDFINLLDLSLDYEITKFLNFTFYFGHVIGKDVVKTTYQGRRGNYFYWEMTRKF
ncbi:MAG: alginate export family protein [Candidatus Melainabacteria bacterium]|nr:alginate export family protein [Candidatus Melainabacteria bacterium]